MRSGWVAGARMLRCRVRDVAVSDSQRYASGTLLRFVLSDIEFLLSFVLAALIIGFGCWLHFAIVRFDWKEPDGTPHLCPVQEESIFCVFMMQLLYSVPTGLHSVDTSLETPDE